MASFGVDAHLDTLERLTVAYAEPHRYYHTWRHIASCLEELDEVRELANIFNEAQIALWFHDAVYAPTSSDNERRSAEWAAQFLESAGIAEQACDRVYRHIMATRHDRHPLDGDSALVVDVDLSILGKSASTYAEFERNVRDEYRHIPLPLYRDARRSILQSFLDREHIYCLPHFRTHYEDAARTNLSAAIRSLT
jgi:predicted metal-dependent HD superfamily phosphohydrolase